MEEPRLSRCYICHGGGNCGPCTCPITNPIHGGKTACPECSSFDVLEISYRPEWRLQCRECEYVWAEDTYDIE